MSTLITRPKDIVPIGSQVEVIYPPDTPEQAEITIAIGNPAAGRISRSGEFVTSYLGFWGCCGLVFGLFVFLAVIFVFIGMALVNHFH